MVILVYLKLTIYLKSTFPACESCFSCVASFTNLTSSEASNWNRGPLLPLACNVIILTKENILSTNHRKCENVETIFCILSMLGVILMRWRNGPSTG